MNNQCLKQLLASLGLQDNYEKKYYERVQSTLFRIQYSEHCLQCTVLRVQCTAVSVNYFIIVSKTSRQLQKSIITVLRAQSLVHSIQSTVYSNLS